LAPREAARKFETPVKSMMGQSGADMNNHDVLGDPA
jgi:hypothetical protein